MQIKYDKNKITYVFKDPNIDFDFGMMLINQLSLQSCLYGKKTSKKGKDVYEISLKNTVSLTEMLPNIDALQNVKCITDIFTAIMKLEELDIVTKYGVWMKYEHLFWNEKEDCLKMAILPLSEDVEYDDGYSFEERLMETVNFIAGYLPFNIKKIIIAATERYLHKEIGIKDLIRTAKATLEEENTAIEQTKADNEERFLSLVFLRNDEMQEFQLQKDEILIGKNLENVDIDFSESAAVSRLHCKLVRQNQNFFLQDLDSLNHTLVNGERIPPYEYMELEDRDLITIGDIEIRVNIE